MKWGSNRKNLTIISLFLASFILLYYSEELTSKGFIHPNSPWVVERDELEIALEKASTVNKTVIVAVINGAYVEPHENEYPSMFDLFLEGFWNGEETRPLLRRLLVVSMDRTAHERCEFRRLNCYLLAAEGGEDAGERLYMSEEFIEMMWRRTAFLLEVLRRGYNLIFTDTDVLWLRDPWARLMKNETVDLQISSDRFNGDPSSEANPINTGFYLIRSSNRTTSFFQKWYDTRKNSTGMKEQDVLQMLIRDNAALAEFNVSAAFLDTLYFSGFCSDSQDVGSVITVHANCCRTIKAKVVDLKRVLMDWRRFKGNTSSDFRWSAHTACENSWT